MLSQLLPLLDLLALLLLVAMLSRSAVADEGAPLGGAFSPFVLHQPNGYVAIDLLAFSQWDDGGDPLVDEGFRYEALSLDFRLKPAETATVRGTAVVAYLQNDPLMVLPSSIANAHVTSASTDFVTLDSSLATDLVLGDGNWIISPGIFYHHQWAYLSTGLDFDVRRILAGGDTVLRVTYNGRFAWVRQVQWDGSPVIDDQRITNNLIVGVTQVFSAHLIANASLQYTNQAGLLSSTLQFVGLYKDGQPVLLVDEVLPRSRNRGQLNLRGRYTTSVGTSFGLDLSGYGDDWGLVNVAIEPNVETPLGGGVRLRAWYRLSDQKGTRYFTATPQNIQPYMTQNSNLGSFVNQNPGLALLIPLGPSVGGEWMLRSSLLGFYRSDRIFGVGGSMGFSVEW